MISRTEDETQQIQVHADRPRLSLMLAAGDPFVSALVVLLIAIMVVASMVVPGFPNQTNFTVVLQTASIIGIVAVGMTFVTMVGSFISLGTSQMAMVSAVTFAYMFSGGISVEVCLLVGLLLGVAMGAVQGAIIALGLNPVITTLAAGAIAFGLIATLTESRPVNVPVSELTWLGSSRPFGVPVQVLVFTLVVAIATFVSSRTVLGRTIRLVGANRATARISGLARSRAVIWAFVLFGTTTTIAGVLTAAQLGQATINTMSGLTIDSVAAVLLGGTALSGGHGSPIRSALGAIIIALLNNIMVLVGAEEGLRQLLVGLIIVAVVVLLQIPENRRKPR